MSNNNDSLIILTYLQDADAMQFARLKRKKWGKWKLLVRGEWSQSPFHQGCTSFFATRSKDKSCWALLEQGFPRRIVAIAQTCADLSLEEISAAMMHKLASQGGPLIESPYEYGDINSKELWAVFDSLRGDMANG